LPLWNLFGNCASLRSRSAYLPQLLFVSFKVFRRNNSAASAIRDDAAPSKKTKADPARAFTALGRHSLFRFSENALRHLKTAEQLPRSSPRRCAACGTQNRNPALSWPFENGRVSYERHPFSSWRSMATFRRWLSRMSPCVPREPACNTLTSACLALVFVVARVPRNVCTVYSQR
jgi:hypothetical protein